MWKLLGNVGKSGKTITCMFKTLRGENASQNDQVLREDLAASQLRLAKATQACCGCQDRASVALRIAPLIILTNPVCGCG